jgi:hypothetical protein
VLQTIKWVAMGGLIALAGCAGGPPTDADVEAAMKARVAMDSGADDSTHLLSAKNTGCRPDDDGAYLCDVTVVMDVTTVGKMTATAQLRMVKSGERWTFDPKQVVSMQGEVR